MSAQNETDISPFCPNPRNLQLPQHPHHDDDPKRNSKIIIDYCKDSDAKFQEKFHLDIDGRFEYARSGKDPGLILIFNHETFHKNRQTNRKGSTRDVNTIIECMGRLGYNISANNVFNDLKREEVFQNVDRVLKADLSEVNCVMVFFLTHGNENNLLEADDTCFFANKLWERFSNCEQLVDIPKLFFLQACKGKDVSVTSLNTIRPITFSNLVPEKTFNSDYIGPDMLIVYSASEGNVSFRNKDIGSWFIQELCKNFLGYGRRDDILSLITRTSKCVCGNYFQNELGVGGGGGEDYPESEDILKQMPLFISTLRKKFYLNRSKDRSFLFSMERKFDEMSEQVRKLECKLEELSDSLKRSQ